MTKWDLFMEWKVGLTPEKSKVLNWYGVLHYQSKEIPAYEKVTANNYDETLSRRQGHFY